MEHIILEREDPKEEAVPTPTISERLSALTAEQTKDTDMKISELSHLNDGETGFNPTAAEMAEVFEGIKEGIKKRGKKKETHEIQKK